jgi:hypothetical protein
MEPTQKPIHCNQCGKLLTDDERRRGICADCVTRHEQVMWEIFWEVRRVQQSLHKTYLWVVMLVTLEILMGITIMAMIARWRG